MPDLPQAERTFTSCVDKDSAVVNAEVDPGFGLTLYRFEYGTDTSYGQSGAGRGADRPRKPGQDGDIRTRRTLSRDDLPLQGAADQFRRQQIRSGRTRRSRLRRCRPSPRLRPRRVGQTTATLGRQDQSQSSPTTYHFEYGTSPGLWLDHGRWRARRRWRRPPCQRGSGRLAPGTRTTIASSPITGSEGAARHRPDLHDPDAAAGDHAEAEAEVQEGLRPQERQVQEEEAQQAQAEEAHAQEEAGQAWLRHQTGECE